MFSTAKQTLYVLCLCCALITASFVFLVGIFKYATSTQPQIKTIELLATEHIQYVEVFR